jgi:hypothetical protein
VSISPILHTNSYPFHHKLASYEDQGHLSLVNITVVTDAEKPIIMSCLGLPEEVEFDVHSDGPDIDDGEDQEEARELISPFLADEHYLEEPASIQGSVVSTEDATDQFQRGWRVDRRGGDSWMYGMALHCSKSVAEALIDLFQPFPSPPRT